jgi:peptide deformylase
MKIITIPHDTLRQVATAVTTLDKKLIDFIGDLEQTLVETTKPKGVGLAAPQVDRSKRIFTINLDEHNRDLRSFINPVIVEHSKEKTFGPDEKDPYLEGCLSIPGIYGPVPRWEWLTLEYQVIKGDKFVTEQDDFEDFAARVVQHEFDHLEGVLFTDYSLELDLPIFKENPDRKKMEEIDKSLLQFV